MQFLFGVLLLTSMSVEAAARACPLLFEDGHSFWRVRIPAERTRPIDFAATELTNVIARISGGVAGAAAEPMRAYHARMAEAWVTLPIHSPWNYHNFPLNVSSRLLSPEVQKEVENLLAAAREAVRDDPRAAGEVGIEAASFADWARLAEDARTGRTTYEMPERHGKDVFATLPVLRLRPLRHPSCGWPVAAHGDFGLAATLEFSHL